MYDWTLSTKDQLWHKVNENGHYTIQVTFDDDDNETFALRKDGQWQGVHDSLFKAMKAVA